MNKLTQLFNKKQQDLLALYMMAGYPEIDRLIDIIHAIESSGADILEIGIPFSDPMADGPVIQASGQKALKNGMTVSKLFEILKEVKTTVPKVIMSYFNPIYKFGMEKICSLCAQTEIDGMIIPDLPVDEFDRFYKDLFQDYGLHYIPLVTDKTSDVRLQKAIDNGSGFLYLASAHITTGSQTGLEFSEDFKKKVREIQKQIPVLVGFGISNHQQYKKACATANGAIIGSAYIRALENASDLQKATIDFVQKIKQQKKS
nr:tryptophan synthase subunit alpha [Bacteroidota bacterium]